MIFILPDYNLTIFSTARPDQFIKIGPVIKPVTKMAGKYQYIDLLAANMEITLLPGQYLGIAGVAVAYKYTY